MAPDSTRRPTDSQPTLADRVRARVAETRSLQSVFSEMRTTYRGYRRATRAPAVPELRNAVRDYKRGRSLKSLTRVATFLDERQLLTW